MNTILHQILRFPRGPFFSSLFSLFTSSYNFEVNRHEKVGQKRETANFKVEALNMTHSLFLPSFPDPSEIQISSFLSYHCVTFWVKKQFFDILSTLAKWNVIICLLRTFLETFLKDNISPSPHCAMHQYLLDFSTIKIPELCMYISGGTLSSFFSS